MRKTLKFFMDSAKKVAIIFLVFLDDKSTQKIVYLAHKNAYKESA
jgi:hypothetical protein